jgi:hypothetical protein
MLWPDQLIESKHRSVHNESGAAMNLTRRQFIAASAMAPLAAAAGPASVKDSVQAQAQPFDLDSVRLTDTSLLWIDRAQPRLPAGPRNRPAVAHLPSDRGPGHLGRTAGRLGEARCGIARPLHRTFSVGLRADVGQHRRHDAARQRQPGRGRTGEVPEGQRAPRNKRQWLFERISAVVLRSPEGRPEGLGALVHAAQDHGGPARHVRPGPQRTGARRGARHGRMDQALDRYARATKTWPACCASSSAA